MIQGRKNNRRGFPSILTGIALTSFLLANCSSKKKDNDMQNLLLLALGTASGSGNYQVKFRLSDRNTLLSNNLSQNSQSMRVGSNAGFLEDAAGESFENYGDNDGVNDHFATPSAVSIEVCYLLAYKSEKNGGPARGKETFKNASRVLHDPLKDLPPDEIKNTDQIGPCPIATPVPLKGLNMTQTNQSYESIFDKTINIPEEERSQYDRIGIIARSFTYYFNPSDVPEDSYRYVSLMMNPLFYPNGESIYKRGDVVASIFTNACPPEFLTSPAHLFVELSNALDYDRMHCSRDDGWIDSNSGNFLKMTWNSVDFFASTDYTNHNRPINPLVNDPAGIKKLKFKSPQAMDLLASTEAYIIVTDFNHTSGRKENALRIDISVDNVLFWDSPDTNNVFSPQLDANDRPNALDGTDNLRNAARKNLIFRLPTILSSF
ncbi:sigma factor sigX-regulated lipoprotein SrpA [Leptospira santarosai]|uniref:sigma factor sigX-regulated lipoprotein SrpA n=1 Tax=Leptospira santarosai TaxID=28183 RepID=UPI0002BEBEAF|nr:hypothetical protein [Leptospira santarosai]EMJ48788.1 hypothetical protein LEP1GSC169_1031 [Leptospira santarosai str. HAI1349]EMO23147.1 hypothetical protein LEP1GSC168_1025 [Leptospira santarosai str. HAI134]